MTYDIELGQGDSDEVVRTLLDANGPVNLTGAAVHFIMRDGYGKVRHVIQCVVNSPTTAGQITIPFTELESETPGVYLWEIKVTIANRQTTFSSFGYYTLHVKEAL